ncbi:hypothetical protein [Trichodesmium erythraeum]
MDQHGGYSRWCYNWRLSVTECSLHRWL